jgi:hypothetical protein
MTLHTELEAAWKKANSHDGVVKLITPGILDPTVSAKTLIGLLNSAYTNHAISKDPVKVEHDIKQGNVSPWFVTRNDVPVACAALIRQDEKSSELGRAVSIEKRTGVGKIAMLSAAAHKGSSTLFAEVRLADEFAGIPGSEATQRICLDLLQLVPHALVFAFNHGSPIRREMFAFSSENMHIESNSPLLTAQKVIAGRDVNGPVRRLKQVQDSPFKIITIDDSGMTPQDISKRSRSRGSGFTLAKVEATDYNLSTINMLMQNDFELVGLGRNLGSSGLPVIWLATVARGETLAPTSPSPVLPNNLRKDILVIDTKFRQLAGN